MTNSHQRTADQEARAEARDEQLADRHFRRHAVEDHRDRRRDDHAELRGGRLQRGGVGPRIAVPDQRRDQDRADRERRRHARPGDRREDHAGQHARRREPALDAADDRLRELDEARRDAARLHQVAGEDEERDRGERELVDRREHLLDDGEEVEVRLVRADEARDADGDGDRDRQRERDHHRQEHRAGHRGAPTAPSRALGGGGRAGRRSPRSPRTRRRPVSRGTPTSSRTTRAR